MQNDQLTRIRVLKKMQIVLKFFVTDNFKK